MKITVYDNGGITMDRYTIFIDSYCYFMSRYPDRANEVNTYGGEFKSPMKDIHKMMKQLKFKKLITIPTSVKYAIRQRCREIRNDNNDTNSR